MEESEKGVNRTISLTLLTVIHVGKNMPSGKNISTDLMFQLSYSLSSFHHDLEGAH